MSSMSRLFVCLHILILNVVVLSAKEYFRESPEDELRNEVYKEHIRAENYNNYEQKRQTKRNRLILDDYIEDHDHYSRSRHRNMDQYENRNDKNECHPKKMFQYTNTDVKILIGTLHRMTTFFDQYYLSIIVDGLFGIRVAEGCIENTLQKIKKSHRYYDDIKELYLHIKTVSEKIYSVISKRKEKYVQSFLKNLDKPFNFIRSWRNYRPDLLEKITQKESINAGESDTCMYQLLGVNKTIGACHITDKCFKMETTLGKKGYYLTHQVLYFLSGETHGCHDKLAKKVGTNEKLEHLYDIFGSNIYKQMSKNNIDKQSDLDIVAEQGAICSMLGIVECSRMDTMRKVLHRVEQEGCVYAKDDDAHHNRKRRSEAYIGKCSQHITATTMGYLSSHINFIANPPPCKLIS